jgi:hypothetical protein
MVTFLLLLSGFCWTIVYIKMIISGFKEKTYGMPFIALTLNFSWEVIYSYFNLIDHNYTSIQTWITFIWLLLDIFIIFTYLLYGTRYFPPYCNREYFIPWTLIIFIMSFVLQYFFIIEFGASEQVYSAFLQNLIMSILFINMLVHRNDLKGQNLVIAINKWIGTLAPTILFGIIYGNRLALIIGIFCSVFDLIYIFFLNSIRKFKSSHISKS